MKEIPIYRYPEWRTFQPDHETVPDGTLVAPDGSEVVANGLVLPGQTGKLSADRARYAGIRGWNGLSYQGEAT